ncbi:hypothetical protein SAMN04488511_11982 [Pedobacter suwonensis]|uniref:Uncharacterized protein n=1 Tax=Pedobacter suwonensis TaxID=332999 RepID=A0A1I0U389_9SPHI|nr:hypothetical protein [Pedobacter suwonensis]SFA58515.1 hypothetical protein SAMN04488511_11982 [Pedobacter suwonensis]
MEKTHFLEILKNTYPNEIVKITELDDKKIQIDLIDELEKRRFIKELRNFILGISQTNDALLLSLKAKNFKFEFSVFGKIYEFNHNDSDYRVEVGLITYIVTINGITKTFERLGFEKSDHFKDIAGYIAVIQIHRYQFLELN